MKPLPMLLGAVALALTTGAVAGNALSTEPLGANQDVSHILPQRATVAYPGELKRVEPLPDHYPLETPDGVIEVAELAWHGRYRDRYRQYTSATLPGDEDLYRYDPPEYRHASVNANTSRGAVTLDAQQPDPEPVAAIAQLDAVQSRYDRRAAHVAQAAQRSQRGAMASGEPRQNATPPKPVVVAVAPAVTGQNAVQPSAVAVNGEAIALRTN